MKPQPRIQKRMDEGAMVVDWPEGGIVASAFTVAANRGNLDLGQSHSRCFCAGCGHGFNSVAAFDKHQSSDGGDGTICWDPGSIGMVRNADGWWVTELRDPVK